MNRFTASVKAAAVCMLLFVAVPRAEACAWDPTDNYYLFYAFEGDRTTRAATQTRLTEWWTAYAGRTVTAEDLDELIGIESGDLAKSQNPIVRAAYRKGDKAMQQYLRLLVAYFEAGPTEEDVWYYPDEAEVAAQRKAYANVARRAAAVQPGKLVPQYTLLRMRALFKAEQWQEVAKVWESKGKTQPESVFRDMAMGFYAGALRKLGRDEDACEIYARLGDAHSATWCMHDGRNLGCIRRLYAQNPNSAALHLLVQDFVNNAQETLDGEGRLGRDGYITKVYADEVTNFIAFAKQVANERKTQSPAMWLTAAAWLNYLYGNVVEARTLIDRAMAQPGTPLMKDDARIIRLAISTADVKDFADYRTQTVNELRWLEGKAREGKETFNLYWNAAQRIYLRHLVPLCETQGRHSDALLCLAAADALNGIDTDPLQVDYSSAFSTALTTGTAEEAKRVYHDFFQAPTDAFTDFLYAHLPEAQRTKEFYCDLIGTLLVAEGRFREAISWHEQVSPRFLSAQAVSYYMARRDYTRERWIGKRQVIEEQRDGWGAETLTTLTANPRLQFCRDIVALEEALEKPQSDDYKAQTRYRLATLVFQASLHGDSWFLSAYGRSCYEPATLLDTLAYRHLQAAEAALPDAPTYDDLRARVLFAKAYINLDNSAWDGYQFFNYAYDWETERYTLEFFPDSRRQQSRDYAALATYARRQGAQQPLFFTRCDVLQTWLRRR